MNEQKALILGFPVHDSTLFYVRVHKILFDSWKSDEIVYDDWIKVGKFWDTWAEGVDIILMLEHSTITL